MGFRMRKSVKLAPGVRMTFSKSGIGYSAGVKGYRVTKRADGRVQRTISIPGTGLSHVSSSGSAKPTRSPSPRTQRVDPPDPRPIKPGMFAPKGEKMLYKAVQGKDVGAMEDVLANHPQFTLAAATLAGSIHLSNNNFDRARELFAWVFETGKDPAADAFLAKYVSAQLNLPIVAGVTAELSLDRSGIGLALAELHQRQNDLGAAIEVVEQLEPTTYAALSLAELYSEDDRHEEVVEMTNGMTNEDDASALLCVFRGIAFRDQGFFDAARESFKEALKSKKREAVVRHRALLERARCYEAEGKRAMARKDLERIMAEDSSYEGLAESLSALEI